MKRIIFVLLAVCLLLASPISIHAQFETASVLGYVRDGSGAVVSGATVSLVNQETKTAGDCADRRSGRLSVYRRKDRAVSD